MHARAKEGEEAHTNIKRSQECYYLFPMKKNIATVKKIYLKKISDGVKSPKKFWLRRAEDL